MIWMARITRCPDGPTVPCTDSVLLVGMRTVTVPMPVGVPAGTGTFPTTTGPATAPVRPAGSWINDPWWGSAVAVTATAVGDAIPDDE